MKIKILALDTATRTGWAIHKPGSPRISSGAETFAIRTKASKTQPADHPGRRFFLFRAWLDTVILEHDIDLIVYEMVVGGARAGGNTALVQKGLEATLLDCAYSSPRGAIPVWSFAAATIKKWATGSGVLTHESKVQVVAEAERVFAGKTKLLPHNATKSQPWHLDDNQCDALWLLDLAVNVSNKVAEVTELSGAKGYATMSSISQETLTHFAHQLTHRKWSRVK